MVSLVSMALKLYPMDMTFSPESFTNLNQLTLYPKKNIKGQAKTGGNIIFNKVYFKKFCKQLSVV